MARMTVKEFATARGRTTQGVYQLIRRHQKEMKRHIRTKDGVMVIDEEGQELLDQWNGRPQQATTAIIETEPLRDLEEANKKILRLTEEKADLQAEIIRLHTRVEELLEITTKQALLLETQKKTAAAPEPGEAKTDPKAGGPAEEITRAAGADPEQNGDDPKELRREKGPDPEEGQGGKIEKPGEEPKPEKRKGFFARLFGF